MVPDAVQPPAGAPGEEDAAAGRTETANAAATKVVRIVFAAFNRGQACVVTGRRRLEIFDTLDWFSY
jgi:hypothetical protein